MKKILFAALILFTFGNAFSSKIIEQNIIVEPIFANAEIGDTVPRMPLFEVFTSSTCDPCASANPIIDNIIDQNPGKATVIKYQMHWPGSGDPYFISENFFRKNYYDVVGVPTLFIDANSQNPNLLDQEAFNNYFETPAYIALEATHYFVGNNITVNVTFQPNIDFTGRCRIAVVEKMTTGNMATNGETEFHNVVMKMLPSADGTEVSLLAGSFHSITATGDMTHTFVEEMTDLAVVVFIQNDETQEIAQSCYSTEVVGVESTALNDIHIYPNPTHGVLHIDNAENTRVNIYNMFGVLMQSKSNTNILDISSYPQGTYIVEVIEGEVVYTKKVNLLKD